MVLVSSKLFPIINSTYTAHWSIIVNTDKGNCFLISSSRYMAFFITKAEKRSNYEYYAPRWNEHLIPMKQYKMRKDVTVYDVTFAALERYCLSKDTRYSAINHNCHHIVQFIIKEFCLVDSDDNYIKEYKGKSMVRKCITDAFTGPKAFI